MAREAGSSKCIWLLSLCCFALGCSQQFILGVPSLVASSLNVQLSDVGLLMTAFSAVNAIGTPLILAFTERINQKILLLAGLAVLIAGLMVTALTWSYGVLTAARAVQGIGHGVFVSTSYAAAQKLSAPGHEASGMANVALGFSLAQVMGMPIARFATNYMDWHALYGILAGFALVSMLAVIRYVPSMEPDEEVIAKTGGLKSLVAPFRSPAVCFALCATMIAQIGYMGFYTYVTPYLEGIFGTGGHAVSIVLFAMGLACIFGTKFSGVLSARISPGITVMVSMAGQVMTLCAMLLAGSSAVGIACFICLWITVAWMFLPPQNVLVCRMTPEHAALAIALTTSSLQLGGSIGSAVSSSFIVMFPISSLPLVGIVFVGVAILFEICALGMSRKPKRA